MSTFNKSRLLEFMQDPRYRPLTAEELARELKVDRPAKLHSLLHRLEKKGEIVVTRKGRYVLPEQMHYVTGRLQGHPRGFGFVIPEVREEKPGGEPMPDIYIRGEDLNGAMHHDRVVVRLRGRMETGHPEGEIIRILERGYRRLVGTFQRSGRLGMVTPDETRINWDIIVPREDVGGAQSRDKVVVEITRWPERQRRNPEGKIIEVLGAQGTPGVDVLSI
ncbi:MAG: ribonuclease R, partial [Syntrophomonadaceae bacterium]|nr:ribonuclease R [Syntrophomonadaceae bacterium]